MRHLGGALACFLALAVVQGCTAKEDTTSGTQKEAGGGKSQEEALIEKTLIDLASASTQFPKTKDPQTILRFYAQDFDGITNGESDSLKETEKYLSEVVERINLGEPIGISSKITNIKASVTGTSGWATYESEYKVGSGGTVLQTSQEQCTAIFKRQGESWLIRHEHCSTMQGSANPAQQLTTPSCPIVGNSRSAIYHKPGGQYYAQMQLSPDAVCFKSEEDARAHGFRPSKQ